MILISHRGNIDGPNPELENNPQYIAKAIGQGYAVEIDLWYVNGDFYLGHDEPKYKITFEYLFNYSLWIHCKNHEAMDKLMEFTQWREYNWKDLPNFFWHQTDDMTLTSKTVIWTYPNKPLMKNSIAVLPELFPEWDLTNAVGICSDFISKYRDTKEK